MALYDCDNDIQMACLKVIDAGGDAAKKSDNWTAVEKPVKKEKDPSVSLLLKNRKFLFIDAYALFHNRFG